MTELIIKRDEFVRVVTEIVREVLGDDWKDVVRNTLISNLEMDSTVQQRVEQIVRNMPDSIEQVRTHYGKVNDWDVSNGETVFSSDREKLITKIDGKLLEIIVRPYDPNKEM